MIPQVQDPTTHTTMKTWSQILTTSKRFLASVLLISVAASCATMPKTPEQAYKAVTVWQKDGNTVVQGPIQYIAGGRAGAAYRATIEPNQVRYLLVMSTGNGGSGAPLARDVFDKICVPKGFGVDVMGQQIFFPPAYFIGFLRRVDEEIAKRKKTAH